MEHPKDFRLIDPEKVPRRHGAAVDLLFGGVIVRVEYDAGAGRLAFMYKDDDTQLTRVVRHEKLKHAKFEEVVGKVGLIMQEVVNGLVHDPKGLFTELPKRMKELLDGREGQQKEEDRRE